MENWKNLRRLFPLLGVGGLLKYPSLWGLLGPKYFLHISGLMLIDTSSCHIMKVFDMYWVHCKEEDSRDDPLPCAGLRLLVAAYGGCGRSQYLLFGSLFCQLQRPLTTTLRSSKATHSMLNWSLGGRLYVHAKQPTGFMITILNNFWYTRIKPCHFK
jgi:hypothetical protein